MDPLSDRRRFLVHSVSASFYATPLASFLLNACKSTAHSGMSGSELAAEQPIQAPTYKPTELSEAKSIRLSATDPQNQRNIALYSKAVAAMKATEFPIPRDNTKITWWEAHALIHDDRCPHGNWFFLPWHRAYLHHFELVCRAFCEDSSFSLPYWDWSSDARLPPEFDEGDEQTNPLCNDTRVIGKRAVLAIDEISPARVEEILKTLDFQTFGGSPSHHPRPVLKTDTKGYRGSLEAGPHNKVHATIQGDMGSFISPRDPIFWLHHCNVDRLWEVWRAQVMANKGEPLPPEVRGKDNVVDVEADKAFPGRAYWFNHPVEGYYAIAKEGDVFTATPAKMFVKDVLEASSLGLLYQSPVKAAPPPPVSVALQAVTRDVETAGTEPKTVDPLRTNVPTLVSKKIMKSRWKKSLQKNVLLKARVVKAIVVNRPNSGTIRIEASPDIEKALQAASGKEWTSAALRLKVDGIPTPSDPAAELHIYLNTSDPTGKRDNPSFVGAMSFFGHDHDPEGIGAIFDLLPTIKKLAAAGKAPYGQGSPQPLTFTAVWDRSTVTNDLSKLNFTLDYLEHLL